MVNDRTLIVTDYSNLSSRIGSLFLSLAVTDGAVRGSPHRPGARPEGSEEPRRRTASRPSRGWRTDGVPPPPAPGPGGSSPPATPGTGPSRSRSDRCRPPRCLQDQQGGQAVGAHQSSSSDTASNAVPGIGESMHRADTIT